MPKGPVGGPRPLSEYRIIFDPHKKKAKLVKVGPLGGPRPFAKNNPPVEDAEVAECMMSDAGISFGVGVVSSGKKDDFTELSSLGKQRALEFTESWCRGTKEAQALEEIDENKMIPALSKIRKRISSLTGREDEIDIEVTEFDDSDVDSSQFQDLIPRN